MNDYNNTAHPRVLDAIRGMDGKRFSCYGTDEVTEEAAGMIRGLTGRPDADVHFLAGGTLTNLTSIGAFLRPHEAVISPASSHIYMHETGAIEAAGHKIINFNAKEGKADAASVQAVIEAHLDEHMVKPKLLFISQATELGTIYMKDDLVLLRDLCDKYGLYLYIDGARLSNALASDACDLTLEDLGGLADAFYIGGTKNGLLFGEALVIVKDQLKEDFRFLMKQRGALLAKGFLFGIQFRALLEDGLYLELARHANDMAAQLKEGLRSLGVSMFIENDTNQVFVYVRSEMMPVIEEKAMFECWGPEEKEGVPVRFVTSWATTKSEIDSILDCFSA